MDAEADRVVVPQDLTWQGLGRRPGSELRQEEVGQGPSGWGGTPEDCGGRDTGEMGQDLASEGAGNSAPTRILTCVRLRCHFSLGKAGL